MRTSKIFSTCRLYAVIWKTVVGWLWTHVMLTGTTSSDTRPQHMSPLSSCTSNISAHSLCRQHTHTHTHHARKLDDKTALWRSGTQAVMWLWAPGESQWTIVSQTPKTKLKYEPYTVDSTNDTYFFVPGRGASITISVSVCLCWLSWLPHFRKYFLYLLSVAAARCFYDGNALPVLKMTSCFHISQRMYQNQKTRMFRPVRQVAAPGDEVCCLRVHLTYTLGRQDYYASLIGSNIWAIKLFFFSDATAPRYTLPLMLYSVYVCNNLRLRLRFGRGAHETRVGQTTLFTLSKYNAVICLRLGWVCKTAYLSHFTVNTWTIAKFLVITCKPKVAFTLDQLPRGGVHASPRSDTHGMLRCFSPQCVALCRYKTHDRKTMGRPPSCMWSTLHMTGKMTQ